MSDYKECKGYSYMQSLLKHFQVSVLMDFAYLILTPAIIIIIIIIFNFNKQVQMGVTGCSADGVTSSYIYHHLELEGDI